jgi:hypothetical protein
MSAVQQYCVVLRQSEGATPLPALLLKSAPPWPEPVLDTSGAPPSPPRPLPEPSTTAMPPHAPAALPITTTA